MYVLRVVSEGGVIRVVGPARVKAGTLGGGRLFFFADRRSARTAAELVDHLRELLAVQALREADVESLLAGVTKVMGTEGRGM